MRLTYRDLAQLFPMTRGIHDEDMFFNTVSIDASVPQPKGVFVPFFKNSGELRTAIANGAIAAVWQMGISIPKYTPNHFPILYTDDLWKGLKDMLLLYKERYTEIDNKNEDITNFPFLDEKLLNDFYKTYDIAVAVEKLDEHLEQLSRRENE